MTLRLRSWRAWTQTLQLMEDEDNEVISHHVIDLTWPPFSLALHSTSELLSMQLIRKCTNIITCVHVLEVALKGSSGFC